MTNTPQRAEWWKEFICTKCQFPAPEKLRAQFVAAELTEFCDCGCNSFKVQVPEDCSVAPIASAGGYGAVFETNFYLTEEGKTLEVILLANEVGNLAYGVDPIPWTPDDLISRSSKWQKPVPLIQLNFASK